MTSAETLSELSEIAKQLNQESDFLNAAIKALEAQLAEMNLGLEAAVVLDRTGRLRDRSYSPARDYETVTFLRYCKLGDGWRLAIQEETTDYECNDNREERGVTNEGRFTPLLKASRDLRIAAVDHFDELLDKLKLEAELKLATVRVAKTLAAV
jgi:hypothetical protein